MQLLINHVGYESQGYKQAVLQSKKSRLSSYDALLVCADGHITVAQLKIEKQGEVDNWHQGHFYTIDFSHITKPGRYYIRYDHARSNVFSIAHDILKQRTLSDVLYYFKSQRSSGQCDRYDYQVPIYNSTKKLDAHGGWYNASGDMSKYLSHLSYTNYLDSQQTPMVVWNLLKSHQLLTQNESIDKFTASRLLEEAHWGADFLVRMQEKCGFFYSIIFDKWSKELAQREVCTYTTQDGTKSANYQAGFRQGAGMAIAALARISQFAERGDYSQKQYLTAAEKGYWHLREYNLAYLDDGKENIIDEYCALTACCALFSATSQDVYLAEARDWATRLIQRQQSDTQYQSFWSANKEGSRPYYHAAEAGLPALALCEYIEIETKSSARQSAIKALTKSCQFELHISQEVCNPFGYPRQYIKATKQDKRSSFFIPHDNESGTWWQGENARLGSLAAMAQQASLYIDDQSLQQQLQAYAQHSFDWLLGLNPYDVCMLDGHGNNNPNYLPELGYYNIKGGVCNGMTAGVEDQHDIAFSPKKQADDDMQNWRWREQWLPSASWYLLAVSAQSAHYNAPNSTVITDSVTELDGVLA